MPSESSATKTDYAHIVHMPGVLGGEAHVAGHRIRVRDVVAARDRGGLSPEEIAATAYPSLTLGEVYAALGYYEDHRQEIDQALQDESQAAEEFLRDHAEIARDSRGCPLLKGIREASRLSYAAARSQVHFL